MADKFFKLPQSNTNNNSAYQQTTTANELNYDGLLSELLLNHLVNVLKILVFISTFHGNAPVRDDGMNCSFHTINVRYKIELFPPFRCV